MAFEKLFIAEKPSVAKAIAAELGIEKRAAGSILCRNNCVVTWCFGHLLEQAEPDAYLPESVPRTKKGTKIWRMEDLPIFPAEWKCLPKSDKGVKSQLAAIGKLIRSSETIVNAGDPDREGQLLVDEVLEHFKCRKPVLRFWVSAVDPASIRKGLSNLRDNRKFSGMRDAARGRSRADWLLGMNLSRAYTLANQQPGTRGSLIAVGRVQTPTLMMVARRDYEIAHFVPVPYLSVTADLEALECAFEARWKPSENQPGLDAEGRLLIDIDLGHQLVERLSNISSAAVLSNETVRKKAYPPKAYSLADIQIEASRRFGMTAEQTLDVCQSLYETHKITSYPRTDCSYLPESQHADAPSVLKAIAATFPATAKAVQKADPSLKSPTFNDKKITAHHGIVPVANTADWNALSENEQRIYKLVAKRYIAQFFPVHVYDASEMLLDIGGETFAAKGKTVVVKGWKALFDASEQEDDAKASAESGENQTLPPLQKGDTAAVLCVNGREKETKPPAYYTEGSLIAAMENIWRSFDDPNVQTQLKEAGGIGTPATRASIIAELRHKKYLRTEGKKLRCTDEGRELLKKVSPKIRSAVMTAAFEEKLKEVEIGTMALNAFVKEYEAFVSEEIRKAKSAEKSASTS